MKNYYKISFKLKDYIYSIAEELLDLLSSTISLVVVYKIIDMLIYKNNYQNNYNNSVSFKFPVVIVNKNKLTDKNINLEEVLLSLYKNTFYYLNNNKHEKIKTNPIVNKATGYTYADTSNKELVQNRQYYNRNLFNIIKYLDNESLENRVLQEEQPGFISYKNNKDLQYNIFNFIKKLQDKINI